MIDNNIASGCFNPNPDKVKKWIDLLNKIIKDCGYDAKPIVPTAVCFEMAKRGEQSHKFIQDQISSKKNPVFQFANKPIPINILYAAAYYQFKTGKGNSPSDMDCIIAAQSLIYGHKIATINQKDFTPEFFNVKETYISPNSEKKREIVFMLEPNINNWVECQK